MAVQCQVSSHLPLEQRIAVVWIFYSCGCNAAEASRRLSKEFGGLLLHGKTIKAIIDKFNETGSVKDAERSGRPITATTDAKADELFDSLIRSPQKSTRHLSLELEISHKSFHCLMKKMNLKPFIPRLIQAMHDGAVIVELSNLK